MIILHDRAFIEAIHADQLRQHSGAPGLRDEGLLESALSRPLQKMNYANAEQFEIAAAYLFGLVKNHPFIDGNKRTAFAAAFTFLAINDVELKVSADETYGFIANLHEAGAFRFDALVKWLRQRT